MKRLFPGYILGALLKDEYPFSPADWENWRYPYQFLEKPANAAKVVAAAPAEANAVVAAAPAEANAVAEAPKTEVSSGGATPITGASPATTPPEQAPPVPPNAETDKVPPTS